MRGRWHPDRRPWWWQQVVWLPRRCIRAYGRAGEIARALLGLDPELSDCVPFFLHPQPPAALLPVIAERGLTTLDGVFATPTASFRTILACRRGQRPAMLKLSLGAIVGGVRRALSEREVASSVVMSALLDTIPTAERLRVGFDWFSEPAGAVEASSGCGWLLRSSAERTDYLVPAFSLISVRGDRAPLLVDLIRRSGARAERFVVENLVRPYVATLSFLLFEQGISFEGHGQNVLFETVEDETLTGRLVLRDLSDASVSIALRVAKGRPMPAFPASFFPRAAPFPLASIAADHRMNERRAWLRRGRDTVEGHGLRSFLWSVHASLNRYFRGYDAAKVDQAYLHLWQDKAVQYLNVRPEIRRRRGCLVGLATDEALAWYLRRVDWRALSGMLSAALPARAEAIPIDGPVRRRSGGVYQRVESAWGDLYIQESLPAFFRPAF